MFPSRVNDNRYLICLFLTALLTVITPFAATSFGAASIHYQDVFSVLTGQDNVSAMTQRIVLELRFPRVLLAFVAGAGLAMAGQVLQIVTRNPLADPYLFGISSGASFGAVVVFTLGVDYFSSLNGLSQSLPWWSWQNLLLPVGAFFGAFLSVLIVMGLSGKGRDNQVERMLLAGVATSFMFGALTSLLLYFSSPQATASVLFWSLGSFAKANWQGLVLPLLVTGASLIAISAYKRQILALQTGDETAHTLGINVPRLRISMLVLCSLITAILVASCGGIGFVGLMIPHCVRILLPGKQPMVLTAIIGGLFMVWIDVVARCILVNQELPVGIITAAIGSVFFLFILRHR